MLVLSNSAYPEAFEVGYEWEFDSELKELEIAVIVPSPSEVPNVKAYKYVAAADETRATTCSQKEQRDRYNGAVAAVAIRTFHEVFESDRDGRIQTISLTVQTETTDPATGLHETFPFIAAAADRDEFLKFDLRNVDPAQTLAHMRSQGFFRPRAAWRVQRTVSAGLTAPPRTPPLRDQISRRRRHPRRQAVYLRQHIGEPQHQGGQIACVGAVVDLLGEPVA